MFVIIKDNNDILKFLLNKDYCYKGISFYHKNNDYFINLEKGLYFEDNTKTKRIELTNYSVLNEINCYNIQIYIYKDNKGIDDFALYKKDDLLISYHSNSIRCIDQYLKDYYLSIKNNFIETNYDVLVNHTKYNYDTLKNGDVIEYLGIKIVYFDEFLYINSFNCINNLSKYNSHQTIVKYATIENSINYYIPEQKYELEIEEIEEFKPPNKQNNIEFLKSIMPNLIMCLSMGLMAYLNYSSNVKENNETHILMYAIMPISMLLTSIFIPIVFLITNNISYCKNYKNEKKKYLEYLNNYLLTLNTNIEKYVYCLNSRFFSLFDCKKMMFYANKKTDEYMTLSIGKIIEHKTIKYKIVDDKDIKNKLEEISALIKDIEDIPLFLNILKSRNTTIVTKIGDKKYFFYKYLLEIVYKHHFDDIYVALYGKNNNVFNCVYNLPHLFYQNKRLFINNDEQLQQLDQCKLDKPLIIFAFDQSDYEFNNTNIYRLNFVSSITDIGKNTDTIIEHINNNGYLYSNNKIEFQYFNEEIDFENYFAYIGKYCNIDLTKAAYSFSDIFYRKIESYYLNNDYSLNAYFAFNNNQLIHFDLHESKQGPHGLIGGSTGSGKSELIVSLLLSLCIRYSPEYLNIVLIDYKGGGLKESLSYNNICVPHIVASVSNLENNIIERLIISLHNECKRRQEMFKRLSRDVNVSIMNIDDYLHNINSAYQKMSHLIIVVDEFAELKKENPEQIKELISLSRIGRSLGLHLILATQKPAGIIDDEIWSNSHFKIALKVFDEKDSTDIIKSKDAAYLTNTGSFLMQVDGSTIKGQSIYSKTDILGNDPYKVSILNDDLSVKRTYKKQEKKIISTASFYCNEIIKTTNALKLNVRPLNYLAINNPKRKEIYIQNSFVLGQIDDYINNNNDVLKYDLKDSLLIYSTRKNEINALLNTLNESKQHTIVIGSKIYRGKYISDSILYDAEEDIRYLFDYVLNNKNNYLTLVIEDINCLLSYNESYLDILCRIIKRKDNLNINFIFISTNSNISFKIINSFKNKILININEQSDLSNFYGMRSIYKSNSYYYDESPISFVPIEIEEYIEGDSQIDEVIKHIPNDIIPKIINDSYLIGYDEKTKLPIFANDFIVVSFDEELLEAYKKSYKEIKTIVYNNQININENNSILWLGPGIFNQRLFVASLKDDLDYGQGLLIRNYKKTIIRSLTNNE